MTTANLPDPTGEPLLLVEDLNVVLSGQRILQGIDLVVPDGGVTAVLGRNGAGKTTTLKAILGLVPLTGSLAFGGRELRGVPTHHIVQLGIGYAPEDRGVFGGLTVGENLRLAERRRRRRISNHNYDQVYALFPELERRGTQLAGTLSGGQQQMLAIGRTLLNDNRLLLVDEPTKGLAPRVVGEVVEVLARAATAVPILLVEQNLAVVQRLASRVTVLEQGQVAYTGGGSHLFRDQEQVRRLLGVGSSRGGPSGAQGTRAMSGVSR